MAKYNPPRAPGFFLGTKEEYKKYYKEKESYDRAWEAERARQDYRKK